MLYALIWFAGTATLATTLYTTPFNELNNPQYPMEDVDWPGILTFVEIGICIASLLLGIVVFTANENGGLSRISRCQFIMVIVFLGFSVLAHIGILIIRGYMKGFVGGPGTCADTALATGCPTTRWEASDTETYTIKYDTPYAPDCAFWYWDKMHSYQSMVKIQSQLDGPLASLVSEAAQNVRLFIDWSERSSYGWRVDDKDIDRLVDNGIEFTLDNTNNMNRLMQIYTKYSSDNVTAVGAQGNGGGYISIGAAMTSKPSLSHCWYWGCHPVCTSQRHLINMWWFVTSAVLAAVQMVILLLAFCMCREKQSEAEDAAEAKENKGVTSALCVCCPDRKSESKKADDDDVEQPAEDVEMPDATQETISAPYMKRRSRFPRRKGGLVF